MKHNQAVKRVIIRLSQVYIQWKNLNLGTMPVSEPNLWPQCGMMVVMMMMMEGICDAGGGGESVMMGDL